MAPARRRWRSPRRRRRRPRRPRRGARRRSATTSDTSSSSRTGPTSSPSGPVRCAGSSAPRRPSRSSSLCRPARPCRRCAGALWRSAPSGSPDGGPTPRPPTRPRRCTPPACRQPTAATVARVLAGLHDPEDPSASTTALATSIGIGALNEQHGAGPIDDPIAVAAGWRDGRSRSGARRGDRADRPTASSRSTSPATARTRSSPGRPARARASCCGRSSSALAARSSPDHLTFVLVDYKGGSTFDACAELPHTVGVVTDLDDHLAERALVSLDAEIRRRERLLRAAGADDLAAYRAVPGRAAAASPRRRRRRVRRPGRRAAVVPPGARRRRPARSQPRHPPRAGHPAPGRRRQRRASAPTPTCAWPCDCRTPPTRATSSATTSRRRSRVPRRVARCCASARARRVVFQSARSTGPVTPPGDDGLRVVDRRGRRGRHGHRARRARALDPQRRRTLRRRAAAPPVAAAAARPGWRRARRCPSVSSTCRPSSGAPPCAGAPPTATSRCSAAAGRGRRRRCCR